MGVQRRVQSLLSMHLVSMSNAHGSTTDCRTGTGSTTSRVRATSSFTTASRPRTSGWPWERYLQTEGFLAEKRASPNIAFLLQNLYLIVRIWKFKKEELNITGSILRIQNRSCDIKLFFFEFHR